MPSGMTPNFTSSVIMGELSGAKEMIDDEMAVVIAGMRASVAAHAITRRHAAEADSLQ